MEGEVKAKKSLGQHWLRDEASLKAIVQAAGISRRDTVLEIGPGLGTLTAELVKKARKVIAVEIDGVLATRLASSLPAANLIVRNEDILRFNFNELLPKYKIVANLPYYLTGQLLRIFTETVNQPTQMSLLLQKEVAERLNTNPGNLNVAAIAVQLDYDLSLGRVISADKFTPTPKVDSQIVVFKKRAKPIFKNLNKRTYMRLIKAGFSNRRKKLRSSLAAGLAIDKDQADELLKQAKINGDLRAQDLSLKDWYKLYKTAGVKDL